MAFRMLHISHKCCFSVFLFSMAPTHRRKSSTRNKSQCSHAYVNVMAPLPPFSLTTCLKKSVLFHNMLFVYALTASTSSNTCCQILSIAFLVQTGIPLSENIAKLKKPKQQEFEIAITVANIINDPNPQIRIRDLEIDSKIIMFRFERFYATGVSSFRSSLSVSYTHLRAHET